MPPLGRRPAAVAGVAVHRLKFALRPVLAHPVARGEIVGGVMGAGTLEARVKTAISPRIRERLPEGLVDQGDRILDVEDGLIRGCEDHQLPGAA